MCDGPSPGGDLHVAAVFTHDAAADRTVAEPTRVNCSAVRTRPSQRAVLVHLSVPTHPQRGRNRKRPGLPGLDTVAEALLDESLVDSLGYCLEFGDEATDSCKVERLRSVAQRLAGIGVHLHHDAVRPHGDRRT